MKRLLVLLGCLCALLGGVLTPVVSYAEPIGLNATLTPDKEAYEQGDIATFQVEIANTSEETAEDVTYSVSLPEGMEVVEESSAVGDVGILEPGETFTATVKARVALLSNASDTMPSTGDVVSGVFVCLAIVGVVIVLGSFVMKRRLGSGALTLILALAMGGTLLLPAVEAVAAERRLEAESSCQFELNGDQRSATLVVGFAFSASGQPEGPEHEPSVTMTRAEWIARLIEETDVAYVDGVAFPYSDVAGHRYEREIITAYANGWIPGNADSFSPDEVATRDFVFSTAVLRSGFSDDGSELSAGDAAAASNPGLLAIAIDVGFAQLDESGNLNPQEPFAVADADGLIASVNTLLSSTVEGDENFTYVLQDGVIEVEEYAINGAEFSFSNALYDIAVGDKVVLSSTVENPLGAAGTVVSIVDNGDGTSSAVFEQAEDPAEIFLSFSASQSGLKIDPSMALSSGTSPQTAMLRTAQARMSWTDEWTPEEGSIGDSVRADLDNSGSYIEGTISFSPTIGYDIDWTMFDGFNRCNLDVDGPLTVEGTVHIQNKNAGKDVLVFEAVFPIYFGFSVDIPLYIHVSATGDLHVMMTYDADTSIRWVNEHWQVTDNGVFDSSASAAINVRLGGKAGLEFALYQTNLVDAAIEAGVSGTAQTVIRQTGLTCSDLSGYGYASFEVGKKTDWLVHYGWIYDKDLVTEENSPFKFAWHWEDGERVDSCTYEPGNDDEPSVKPDDPSVNPDDQPSEQDPSGFEDDGSTYPEPTLTGSETPSIVGGEYYDANKLDGSFIVSMGSSITVTSDGPDGNGVAIGYVVDDGTIIRITQYDSTTGSYSTTVTCWPGEAYQWEDMDCTIEVLCGRIEVYELRGWGTPYVAFGSCETIPYPLRISNLSLNLSVGETAQLSAADSFDVLEDYETSRSTYSWRSSDTSVVRVDSEGNVEAVGVGEAEITLISGYPESLFYRTCTVTVS